MCLSNSQDDDSMTMCHFNRVSREHKMMIAWRCVTVTVSVELTRWW